MKRLACWVWVCVGGVAIAQTNQTTLRDLEGKSPRKLSKDEVTQLVTGAQMARVSATGSRHFWTNEPGGAFVISSDNMGPGVPERYRGRPSSQAGKWHISDDGRYCVLIEWKAVPTEEWCRFVLQTSDGYYAVRSDSVGTERAHKLEISK
jgi:hypothetical protein